MAGTNTREETQSYVSVFYNRLKARLDGCCCICWACVAIYVCLFMLGAISCGSVLVSIGDKVGPWNVVRAYLPWIVLEALGVLALFLIANRGRGMILAVWVFSLTVVYLAVRLVVSVHAWWLRVGISPTPQFWVYFALHVVPAPFLWYCFLRRRAGRCEKGDVNRAGSVISHDGA
jgi:hypothetical protein